MVVVVRCALPGSEFEDHIFNGERPNLVTCLLLEIPWDAVARLL